MAVVATAGSEAEAGCGVTSEPMPRLAQGAAANLSAAQALIPQVTNHGRADMRRIEAFRAALQEEAAARGVKLTALAFHVKALARCLAEFPRFNASLSRGPRPRPPERRSPS